MGMRATKKTNKKCFLSHKINLFFYEIVFLSPAIACFFGSRQQSNARAGQKKHMSFLVSLMRGLNLMRALI